MSEIIQEAVFKKGKEKLKSIDQAWVPIKKRLSEMIGKQGKSFKTKDFYKDNCWKDLEDTVHKVFGFRYLEIMPFMENPHEHDKTKMFVYVNAGTAAENRFVIDGLVTDDGFYDSTHSLVAMMVVGIPLLQLLEPEELTAIFLHEIGHNIDPALIDIKYKTINDYSKYICDTDKDKAKKEAEQAKAPFDLGFDNEASLSWTGFFSGLVWVCFNIMKTNSIGFLIGQAITIGLIIKECVRCFFDLGNLKFHNPFNRNVDEVAKQLANKTKENIKKFGMFSKYNSTEAFADNLPRMYGYANHMYAAFHKIEQKLNDEGLKQIYGKDVLKRSDIEKVRAQFFAVVVSNSIKDVHKTEIHRYYSTLKEYYKELNDKNIPPQIKKEIKYDLEQVMKVGEKYFKSPDTVRNKIYTNIFNAIKESDPEAIGKMVAYGDIKEDKEDKKDKKDKNERK